MESYKASTAWKLYRRWDQGKQPSFDIIALMPIE